MICHGRGPMIGLAGSAPEPVDGPVEPEPIDPPLLFYDFHMTLG